MKTLTLRERMVLARNYARLREVTRASQPHSTVNTLPGDFVFKIDDGIPLPSRGRGRGREKLYRFHEMKVGQSVFLPLDWSKAMLRTAYARKLGYKFESRQEGEGTRIWRVADTEQVAEVAQDGLSQAEVEEIAQEALRRSEDLRRREEKWKQAWRRRRKP